MSVALRCLIVEDSESIREDIAMMLRSFGISVFEAENGHAAWVILQNLLNRGEKIPDLIFSDVNMPKMDGIGLLEKVRNHPQFRALPFIILTANKEELLKITAQTLNVNGFFIKPPEADAVLNQLQKLFPELAFKVS